MQSNNVRELESAKWDDLKRLFDEEQKHHAAARACWPKIAARMAELRATCTSNEDFGAALVKHGVEYGKDDRAAFVWMGLIKPAALEDAMARCERRSPRTFRQEVEAWGDDYFATSSQIANTPANATVDQETAESSQMAPPSATPDSAKVAEPEDAFASFRVDSRMALAALPHDIGAAFLGAIGSNLKHPAHTVIRALLQMKSARPFLLWWGKLLIDTVARTPLTKNNNKIDATHIVAGLHPSFQNYRRVYYEGKFDRKAAELLMNEFTELADAARDRLVLAEYQRQRHANRAGAVQQHSGLPWEHNLPRRAISSEHLPTDVALGDGTKLYPKPIVVCGTQFFPSENYGVLSYPDALLWVHVAKNYIVEQRLAAGKDHEDIGRDVALMGTHLVIRHLPEVGRFLSAIGQELRSRGGTTDRAHWFDIEPIPPKTSEH